MAHIVLFSVINQSERQLLRLKEIYVIRGFSE
ncbi:uncharacterized protein METZ01_LOCUS197298 [marine metagenome]|uniref:Uncharacterized protein n=1 Tax=marine metagenome TaxID=408172 RepID=A0A382E2U2_9ZZZZ